LKELGGRWIPASVRYYKNGADQPDKTLTITKATFDQPWHRQELGPEEMGALVGTRFHGGPPRYWGGTELLSQDEFHELQYVYGAMPHPRIVALLAEASNMTTEAFEEYTRSVAESFREAFQKKHGDQPWLVNVKLEEKDAWDEYVEQFCEKEALPEPAIERANKLLERAKSVRDAKRRKDRAEIKKAERNHDERKLKQFDEREDRIFRQLLVKPLEDLARQAKELAARAGRED
jgi:hypothetical protein